MSKDDVNIIINNVKEIQEVSMAISDLNWSKPQFHLVNVIAEFSERNSNLIDTIVSQVSNNFNIEKQNLSDYEYVDNRISMFFIMRDIIENIEIIFYLLLNNSNKFNDNLEIDQEYLNKLRKINGLEKMKQIRISKLSNSTESELEKELFKKYGKKILTEDFERIYKIKTECNNYIHKNGFKFINVRGETYYNFMNRYLKELLFIFKFNFKLLFLLQGHILSSSDYVDYLDMGMTPPENSQYWVAPIFREYIHNQFDKSEIDWLEENNFYGMQIIN